MRLISHRFMGESYAELSLVLMAASYINFIGWGGGRRATPILHGFSYRRLHSSSLEPASVCYRVPCTQTANSPYYSEMDCKQRSVLTCSNTAYLCHPPGRHRYPISATEPTKPHVLLVPAVNVTLLSDNRAWSQNRGRE